MKDQILNTLLPSGPIRDFANQLLSSPAFSNPEAILKHVAGWGRVVFEGFLGFFVVLIVAIYFLADGERVYKWLLDFLPEAQRQELAVAGEEVATIVGHYMVGQVITSVLRAAYARSIPDREILLIGSDRCEAGGGSPVRFRLVALSTSTRIVKSRLSTGL